MKEQTGQFIFNFKSLNIAYQNNTVIKGLNLRVKPQEHIALIGPSGAGKTTLLKKLYQCQPQVCSFIHQHYALVPQLSVFHNVYIARLDQYKTFSNIRNLLIPAKEIVNKIQPVLSTLGLADKIKVPIHQLSGGQKQRVAIARSIFRDAPVTLADEPVSSIDPEQAKTVLKKILIPQKTVIASLHSVELALQNFQRIIGLKNGCLAFDLSPSEITPTMLSDLYTA